MNFALGEAVEAGHVLVQLDDRVERLKLAEKNARRQALPKQIEALKRQIAAQREVLVQSERTLQFGVAAARVGHDKMQKNAEVAKEHSRQTHTLHEKGLVSHFEWLRIRDEEQQAQLAVQGQAEEIHRLEADVLVRSNLARAELEESEKDLADLLGQLERYEATVNRLENEIERHRIIAPIGGRVGEVVPELRVGTYLTDGRMVAKIVPFDELKVVARFLPKDALGRVRSGQTGRMRLDAFPWAQYGTIAVRVERVGEEIHEGYQQVELALGASRNVTLQHGLTGTVEVEVEKLSPAYLVLRAAGRMMTRPVIETVHSERF
ncbi:MAG: HlyD family secretion protein [Gammaproteobacteria bacterium]